MDRFSWPATWARTCTETGRGLRLASHGRPGPVLWATSRTTWASASSDSTAAARRGPGGQTPTPAGASSRSHARPQVAGQTPSGRPWRLTSAVTLSSCSEGGIGTTRGPSTAPGGRPRQAVPRHRPRRPRRPQRTSGPGRGWPASRRAVSTRLPLSCGTAACSWSGAASRRRPTSSHRSRSSTPKPTGGQQQHRWRIRAPGTLQRCWVTAACSSSADSGLAAATRRSTIRKPTPGRLRAT